MNNVCLLTELLFSDFMIEFIITLLYLHIVTLEIKVTNVNSQAFQEFLELISSNYILSCSYLLIRLCPDNFCQHPDSELKVTSKLAVYTKLIPNLGNYPAILSLDDCTKTFCLHKLSAGTLGLETVTATRPQTP